MAPNPLAPPVDLGFLPKFATWYPDQITAVDKAVFSTKRFTALGMPTGSGKSLIGIATALLMPGVERALYLTSTKGLQDQLALDFTSIGLYDVRGQRNYTCRALEAGGELDRYRRGRYTHGCDEGPCHSGVRCSQAPVRSEPGIRPSCTNYGALWDARRASLVSSNYSMYLTSTEYSEGLGKFDLLILDEAHDADKELESFLAVDITIDDAKYISSKFLKSKDVSDWRDWAAHHASVIAQKLLLREQIPPTDIEGVKDTRRLKTIAGKLNRLKDMNPLNWILDSDSMTAKFCPMKVSTYAEQYLFKGIPHILLMSATMTRKTTQLLGINPDHLQFWECPSRFALERRPVICVETTPSVRVDMKMSADDKFFWQRRIDRIIEPRRALEWKGIIHTVSYQRMKDLMANSEHKDIMMTHDSTNTQEVVQQFKQCTGPKILVSPSIVTGYDFPNDQCRYQILGKVPMPDMRSAIMMTRKDIDPEYAGYLAMIKLVQACGRGMRGSDDWCETFIVDDHFPQWFLKRYRKHAPRWFLDAICYTEVFPEPMDPSQFADASQILDGRQLLAF